MKKRQMMHLVFFVFLMVFTVHVEAQFSINTELRSRLEFRSGYQQIQAVDEIPAVFVSQRTRFSIDYKNEKYSIRITPQDVRVWGDEQIANLTAFYGNEASLDLFEAYANIHLKGQSWLKIGRQQISYDNEWLLSARNFNQHGNALDAVVFGTKKWKTDFQSGISWNANTEMLSHNYYPEDKLKTLNFLRINRKIKEHFNTSFLYIASGSTKNDTSDVIYVKHTTGLFAEYKKDKLLLLGNGYYQTGVNTNGIKVSAVLLAGEVGLKFKKQTITAGFSYLSGNKSIGSEMNTDHLFDMLQGARHRYFGYMDYFRNFSSHTMQGGISDPYFRIEFLPSKKITISSISHYFMLAQANALTGADKRLGFEQDLVLKYSIGEWGKLEMGYCFLLPTNTLKRIHNIVNDKFSQFAYLQLTISSQIFSQKE